MIERMAARIPELEALVGEPRETASNSHIPPSKDCFGKKGSKGRQPKTGKRPPREGKHRPLAEVPDNTERVIASACNHCGTDVTGQMQQCRQRYDHVDLSPIRPVVARVELWGGRCRCCGRRYKDGVSDRYSGQQELGGEHQVCLAHVLRDGQCAIDSGDTVFATRIRDHLRWAIRVGRRRDQLKHSTLAAYAAKADNTLDRLVAGPVAHPAGRVLLMQIKAWRGKFFVFLANRDVPATNNISEREIRPSIVFRKVMNGFRSDWGAQIHAGYRSVTGTARVSGQSALSAIPDLVEGNFAVA
jgi:hypothetical protein